MKIYLLIHKDCEHYDIIAIYASKELANKARAKLEDTYFVDKDELLTNSSIPLYGIK